MFVSAKGYKAIYSRPSNDTYQVSFVIDKWNVQPTTLNGTIYNQIIFDNSTVTNKKGWAELPFVSAAIQLSAQKNVDIKITDVEYKDYPLSYPLVPSRGTIYRNQNPNTIPYIIDPASIVDKFYPFETATADEPYIIRDIRGTSVRVYPFQYNSATKTLRVYTKVDVQLIENNSTPVNSLRNENMTPVKEMIGMYQSLFINFDKSRYDLTMAQYGDILVIATARDTAAIRPYIQWKREKGFNVTESVVATGTNVKNLIQQSYNSNNNLLYVEIVGDWADVKVDNSIDNEPVDPKMGCVVGTDNFPDISVGRFSCNNSSQLTIQVNKTINYEKNADLTTGWRDAFAGVGSDQGPGDDSEYDYIHIQRIYSERLQPKLNYATHYENYGANPSASQLAQYINQGVSTIAYCGHGSQTSWGTTGFSNTDINSLTNGAKLPFIVSVACNNGTYDGSGDCFAEAWLKKENGGAIVTLMSSISQPWNPPMRGEDYFYDILGGGFDYSQYQGQNGIITTEQRTTWGSIAVNAACLMLTESQESEDIETAHTWCTFGDASIQLRTKLPISITSSNNVVLTGIPYTTTINSSDGPVANALVCISQNGQYYSGTTDNNGNVTINSNILPGPVLLVVTAFNATTIYENIDCISPDGPYLIYNSYQLDGDNVLSYGETTGMSITMKNVGNDPTVGNTTVTISCNDPLLTINNSTVTYGLIAPNETQTQSGFNMTVSPEIENGHSFNITVMAANSDTTWQSTLHLTAYKPVLAYSGMTWDGSYTPGQTLNLVVTAINNGGFPVSNVSGTVTTASNYVTINGATQNFGNIAAGATAQATYSVTISADCPETEVINFAINLTGDNGAITGSGDFQISNSCNIQFDLTDSYGDGWNGASLVVSFSDGSPSQTLTVSSGHTAQYIMEVNSGTVVSLTWQSGSYDSECSFVVSYQESGATIYQSNGTLVAGLLTSFTMDCGVTCSGVSNLKAIAGGSGTMNVTWTAPEGSVVSYNVYRDNVLVANVTVPSYTDTNLPDATYTYCVEPIYADGCIGMLFCAEGVCGDFYNMLTTGTSEVTLCSGIIYDDGGPDANYSNNCDGIMIVHASTTGAKVHLSGSYVTENNYDKLYIYDGEGTSGTLLGTFMGTGTLDVTSTGSTLTLHFTSDNSVNKAGFALTVACEGGVSTLLGDANNDNLVNIADVAAVVAYMMEQNPSPFILTNADINSDGIINVIDIQGIINIILGDDINKCDESSIVAKYYVKDGYLYIDSPVAISALQIQLNGKNTGDIRTMEVLNGFEKSASWIDESEYMLIAYNMKHLTIAADNKMPLMYIGNVTVGNIVLSDNHGCGIDVEKGTEGIGDIISTTSKPYPNPFNVNVTIPYTVASNSSVECVITNINGQTVDYRNINSANAGSNSITWTPSDKIESGIYFVTIKINGVDKQISKVIYQK